MSGLGTAEILVLLSVGIFVFGIPLAIVTTLVLLLRKPNRTRNGPEHVSYPQSDREPLRQDLAAQKSKDNDIIAVLSCALW